MGKDAQGSVVLNEESQKKFDECVAALTALRWPDGPPKDTTFAEIEAFGHEVGRNSKAFGRMMEAEADSRGFFKAAKQGFVSDGLPYNWNI